jgi:thiamine pyrophosphate-dependent acetolactate synthase large subunit-like protein
VFAIVARVTTTGPEQEIASPGSNARNHRARPTVPVAVAHALLAGGVSHVFGVLGSGNFVVTDALCDGGADFIRARHEAGAVAMADGFARIAGVTGVASVHQGPGLTNSLTALAEAVKCQTPMLVLSGETAASARSSNFRIDQHGLAKSVGAGVERIYGRETAFADAQRALRRARRERRPVVLMMPVDIQQLPIDTDGRPATDAEPGDLRSLPAPEAVERAADLIAEGSRPIIIAGRGAVLSGARRDVERLGDRIGALLATTAMGKGLFFGSGWEIGISGGFAAPAAAEAIRDADIIIAFGAGLNHWTTRHHTLLGPEVRIIQVDDRPDAFGRNTHVDASLLGDAAAAAACLEAELAARGHRSAGYRATSVGITRWAELPYEDKTGEGRIDPRSLTMAFNRELPVDCNVVVDSGHFAGWPAMYLDVRDPRRWAFCNGFQAVGLGLGAAIGAAVADRSRLTVAAVGDGGFFMALPELESAVHLGVPLVVLVYNDDAYGAEVHHFGPSGFALDTVRFPETDFVRVAEGLGAEAMQVRSPQDLSGLKERISWLTGPLVIDAKVAPGVRADWIVEAFREG